MAKYQSFLSRIGSNRDRAALRGIFSQFLTDDDPPALKDLVLASIVLSGAETTQVTISGACTTGILQSGTSTTAYSITGAFTTGINIAADGTTAIAVTNAFSGVNMISLAGTGSTSGIIISGACAIPLNITGAFTTGITIAADGTTGISITSAFSGVNAISLAGTGSTAGINISGNHTTAITIGAQTTAGVAITGATATGISVTGACSTAALQLGVSGTPAGDFIWYGTTALHKVLFDADGDTNGAVYIGADTKGLLFNLYGDTTGCGVFWDPSTDTNGTLSIGASGGSKGNDLVMYGATNGNYAKWDQSANSLLLVGTSTVLSVAGTTAATSPTTGAFILAGGAGIAGDVFLADDKVLSLGTTVATAETKITMEFDETTTGIGLFNMGSLSAPMVLNTNPGATVAGHTINILHSAGAGDCDDLLGSYTKVAFSGDGDSGCTAVGGAFRAYVGTAVGDATVVKELYGIQPWCSHDGTGAITAMSALSAKCDVNTGAFTASTVNAGHFHIEGAGAVTGQFDGVMIEVYPDVTCLDSMLALAVDSGATVTSGIRVTGAMTNLLKLDVTTAVVTNALVPAAPPDAGTMGADKAIVIDIGGTPYYIPLYDTLHA